MTSRFEGDNRVLLDEIRRERDRLYSEGAGRMTADEAGAIAHERAGRHDRYVRCLRCGKDGRALLEKLVGTPDTRPDNVRSETHARARTSDPSTSHAAAATVNAAGDLTERQRAVLLLFRDVGQMTDEEVAHHYGERGEPTQSDSGLRTRRHELVEAGLLVDTTLRRPTRGGNPSTVWGITANGLRAIRGRRAA